MKTKILYLPLLLLLSIIFNGCAKIEPLPDVAQPLVLRYSEKATFEVGDTTIITGAEKDYEQGSKVIFKLTVKSSTYLLKFDETTTSDAVSLLSRIVRTEPADAIDDSGNFIKKLNNVVVYYAYYINSLVPVSSTPIVTFGFQNEKGYTGSSSEIFTVIKEGSTSGKKLTIINLAYADRYKSGIGCQRGLDFVYGWRTPRSLANQRGPFFSITDKMDYWRSADAITAADRVDFVGYITTSARTSSPAFVQNVWNLVSPSDTIVLTSTYAGALVARITFGGGATSPVNGHKVDITVGGIKKQATFVSSTSTTASNFVTANKAAYAVAGITLTSSSNVLSFIANSDGFAGFNLPSKIEVVSGTMYANDELGGVAELDNNYTTHQDLLLRKTIREMASVLKSRGKSLQVTKFKRLDNSVGADKVSLDYFDLLTYDNEFDVLLGDCAANGSTIAINVGLNQVWGFVMRDGRRGLIKTSSTQARADALILGTTAPLEDVPLPTSAPNTLYCQIKVQENK